MKQLLVKREFLGETYTIGKFYVDGVFICHTLEDRVRDYNKDGDLLDAEETKIFGETAIPYGTYKVVPFESTKFGKCYRVLNVKHFEGILIHCGNTAEHTHGCILVGNNTQKGMVLNSRPCLNKIIKAINGDADIKITIQ